MSGEGVMNHRRPMRPVAADTPDADPDQTLVLVHVHGGKRVTRKDAPPGYLPFTAIAFGATCEEIAATVARAMDRE